MTTATNGLDRAVTSPPTARLRAMDSLRLLAALGVVLIHYTARDHTRWGEAPMAVFPVFSEVIRYGYVGVHLFFTISGFVILMSVWGRTAPQYVASRVSRLYPAFWVAVVATALLRWLWPTFEGRSVGEVLANLTMLNEPFDIPHVDGVYWTLWVEMQFYLAILVLLMVGITRRRVLAFATITPLACTAVVLTFPSHVQDPWTILGWASTFGAGMVMYVIYREGHTVGRWALVALNVAQSVVVAAVQKTSAVESITSNGEVSPGWLALGVVVVTAMLAVVAYVPRVRDLDWRVLTTLGALTYPLYLLHEYVGWALIEVLHPYLGPWVTVAVVLAACAGAAWLVHRYVERPFHRPLRRWLERQLTRLFPPAADLPLAPPLPRERERELLSTLR